MSHIHQSTLYPGYESIECDNTGGPYHSETACYGPVQPLWLQDTTQQLSKWKLWLCIGLHCFVYIPSLDPKLSFVVKVWEGLLYEITASICVV